MKKIILHIDFDSFFASVEQQLDPQLRNKPIGVTAANSRTAIIAASREAKKMGVKGGSSWYEARKLCPQMILVPAQFTRYFEISKKFLSICRLYAAEIEVFSIDELFMDVTPTVKLFGTTEKLIKRLKLHIARDIGEHITVSVGVSHNKILAKLASGMEKPNGVTVITPQNVDSVYKTIELTDMCGIGPRIADRLHVMGVTTLLQLRTIPLSGLTAEFGPHAATFLHNVAWGKDETPLSHFGNGTETKSVGRNYALPKNEYDKRVILQHIFELYEEVGIKLRRLNKKARTVGLYLQGDTTGKLRKTVTIYTNSGKELFEIVKSQGLFELLETFSYVRQISVWVGNLSDEKNIPTSLFDFGTKQQEIAQVVDNLNERFGDHTVRNGFLLHSEKLTTVPNGFLADRWERKELTRLD